MECHLLTLPRMLLLLLSSPQESALPCSTCRAQTRLDSGALVKARVDSDSIVSLHWEGLVHPDTTAGVSVQVNARDFDTPPRLGFFASAVKV